MKFIIIADDLTGALDSAVTFVGSGRDVICARSEKSLTKALETRADIIAISTGSRELSENEAVARVSYVKGILQQHPVAQNAIWFKKIDSRLKGHLAAETLALHRTGQTIILCPAIPKMQRYVIDGNLVGNGVAHPLSIKQFFDTEIAQTIDAKSEKDIDHGIKNAPQGALFVGASGLADALSQQNFPQMKSEDISPLVAPALLAIGSRDPITLAQLDGLNVTKAPNGEAPMPNGSDQDYQALQLIQGDIEIASQTATETFADSVASWVRYTKPRTLIASGGETAAAILQRLDINLVRIKGEIMPGLPLVTAVDGVAGLNIVTKSGGFGPPDTLVKLVGKFVKLR